MSTIVPRWEWRTFGSDFGVADETFAALEPELTQESDEIYLLSPRTDAAVKIRAGLMDIKELKEVDEAGLQQWQPAMKETFPLPRGEAAKVCAELRVSAPGPGTDAFSLDEFLAVLAAPERGVRAVAVHKRRLHYTFNGCMIEVTEVVAEGQAVRTLAVELEDAERVVATVRELGLFARENTSYPRWLKAAVGMESREVPVPVYAVIDIGTSSVKFHIGERRADGSWATLVDRAEVTRLGEGIAETGDIAPAAIERTIAAIAAMATEARSNHASALIAVGTMGMRSAGNSDDFIARVRKHTGVTIEVIPGEEEARLAYLAAVAGLGLTDRRRVVFDTGGGSTQFTIGDGRTVNEQFSVNVGAVRLTSELGLGGPVSRERLDEALAAIAGELGRLDGLPAAEALVGMGGAITNMTAVMLGLAPYDPEVVQGTVLGRAAVDRQIELYRAYDVEQRREIVGLQPKRADVILAGACVVRTVMDKLGQDALTVSDRGLRHGVLLERFG